MSAVAVCSLVVQGLAVAIVLRTLGRRWIFHPGAIFVLAAAMYHGVNEVLQAIAPDRNHFRSLVTQGQLDAWLILVGPSMVLFALAYTFIIRRFERREPPAEHPQVPLPLPLLLALTIPMYVYSLAGRAYVSTDQAISVVQGLVGAFLLMGIGLTGHAIAARVRPSRRPMVVLAAGLASAFLGQRAFIIVEVVLVLSLLARDGQHVSFGTNRGQRLWRIAFAGAIVLLGVMSISAARVDVGRAAFTDSSASARQAFGSGIATVLSGDAGDAVLDDLVYRFDGNVYPALVLYGLQHRGAPPVGMATATNSLRLAVPSFLSPAKLSNDITARNEEAFFNSRFEIDPRYDYLPSVFGVLLGDFGPSVFPIAAAGMGLLFGAADSWLLRRRTSARFYLGIGLLLCALLYEQGIETYPVTMRAAALLALASSIFRILVKGRRPLVGRREVPNLMRMGSR